MRQHALNVLKQAVSEYALARLAWSVIDLAIEAIRHGRVRLAVIADDAFQYLDKREAALIIKGMLEIHPPEHYEKIVAMAATSEGLSRSEIGRHNQPPPEKDLELCIGKDVAWQTPIHKEAVRQTLREASA